MTKNELLLKVAAFGAPDVDSFRYRIIGRVDIKMAICEVYEVAWPWTKRTWVEADQNEIDLWDMAVEQCYIDAQKMLNKLIAEEHSREGRLSHD